MPFTTVMGVGSALAGALGLATMKKPKLNTKAPVDALYRQTAAANRAVAAQGGLAGLTPFSQANLIAGNEMNSAGILADLLNQQEALKYQGDLQQQGFQQQLFSELLAGGLDLTGVSATKPASTDIQGGYEDQIMMMLEKLLGGG
jgi:hypothetical protein